MLGNDTVRSVQLAKVEIISVPDLGQDQLHHVGLSQRGKEGSELNLICSVCGMKEHFELRIRHTHKISVFPNRPVGHPLQLFLTPFDIPFNSKLTHSVKMGCSSAEG